MQKELLFVYGTLKKGFGLNSYLKMENSQADYKAVFCGHARTEKFEMYDLGSFPGIVKGDGVVFGELYQVSSLTLSLIDRIEGEGSLYKREKHLVKTEFGDGCSAWIYLYLGSVRKKDQVLPGVWK